MSAVLIALYALLSQTDFFQLPASIEGAASLGAVAIVGLLAATSSCLAIVGGLLLSVSAKWAQAYHPATRWQKLRPLLLFNGGRLGGYFLLGGLVGILGHALALSVHATGYLTIIVAVVMLLLGINVLGLVPKQYCT
ncbi:MAG TPA: sulfite exporter TauE/SafE family protein, partial [Tepidisphaeraceae bacterium]